ncbi:embryonic polyadenylate-binding protein 2 [Amazona ochrocephala]
MWRRAVRTWWPEVRTRRREIPTWRREFSMWRREIRAWQRAQEELQAITARAQEMEEEAAWMRELQLEIESSLAGNLEASLLLKEIYDKMEIDQRSIYVGNVDYGATAEELEAFFHCCGKMNRVTILRDRFSGHPKGYAYIEFEEQSSMKAAMVLNKSLFRGRVIKVSSTL